MSWGKIHNGDQWWREEGLFPYLSPTETKVVMYLTARCGSLQKPRIVTVEEVRKAVQGGYERVRKAMRLLRRLGVFEVHDGRDDAGHTFRAWKMVDPDSWNQAELMLFMADRKGRAVKLSEERSHRAEESGVLLQGPVPQTGGVASPAERGGSQSRTVRERPVPQTDPNPFPQSDPFPVPQTAGGIEEVEEERRGAGGSALTPEESALPHEERETLGRIASIGKQALKDARQRRKASP